MRTPLLHRRERTPMRTPLLHRRERTPMRTPLLHRRERTPMRTPLLHHAAPVLFPTRSLRAVPVCCAALQVCSPSGLCKSTRIESQKVQDSSRFPYEQWFGQFPNVADHCPSTAQAHSVLAPPSLRGTGTARPREAGTRRAAQQRGWEAGRASQPAFFYRLFFSDNNCPNYWKYALA
jgi:hypothetical protein